MKQNIVEAHENGMPRKKIAEQFGISLSSVGRIIRQKTPDISHENKTVDDVKTERMKRIEDLEKRIYELEKKILEYEAKRKG